MTRYFALALNTNNTSAKPAAVRRTKPALVTKNPAIWLIILLFGLGVGYLLQVNSISTIGYEIKALEERLASLKQQNKRLEIEATSLRAVEAIQAETRAMNLVPAGQARHLGADSDFTYHR